MSPKGIVCQIALFNITRRAPSARMIMRPDFFPSDSVLRLTLKVPAPRSFHFLSSKPYSLPLAVNSVVSFSSPVSTEFSDRYESRAIFGVQGECNNAGSIPVCVWKRSSVFSATKVSSGSPTGPSSSSSSSDCSARRVLLLDSARETGALGDAKLVSLPADPEKAAGALGDAKLVSLPADPEKAAGALGDAKLVSLPEGAGKELPKAENPEPRPLKPEGVELLVAKGEASDVDLFGIAKGEGLEEAFPNALAVKVCQKQVLVEDKKSWGGGIGEDEGANSLGPP
jgi:hypothetical protein